MNEEVLKTKEIVLKEQLKIVQLEKEKCDAIKCQDFLQARKINEQIEEAKNNLKKIIIPYQRLLIEQDSEDLDYIELLFTLALLENKFRKIILETELLEKNKLLKENIEKLLENFRKIQNKNF